MNREIKILLVEDDVALAEMAKELLAIAGCETALVHTGKAGIELASEKKFDLIALDISLPDMSGFEICRDLKQRHLSHCTPVVLMSGHSSKEYRQHGLELGAVDFITKPFNAAEFASRILSHVENEPALITS
jgi:DNA-binding response OmpR family regulator